MRRGGLIALGHRAGAGRRRVGGGRFAGCSPPPTRTPPRSSSRSRRASRSARSRARSSARGSCAARARSNGSRACTDRAARCARASTPSRRAETERDPLRARERPHAQLPGRAARGLHRRADRRAPRGRGARRRRRLREGDPRSRVDRVARHLRPEPRRLSVPRYLPASARHAGRGDRASVRGAIPGGLEADRAAREGAGPHAAPGRDARLDRREGNRRLGGARARRRRLPQSPEAPHAARIRPDRDLRDPGFRRQPAPPRSRGRGATPTTPTASRRCPRVRSRTRARRRCARW